MLNTPFSPWPKFTQHEADAVSRVLLSNKVNYWTGEECRQFEREFADWTGSKYAIALGNGTLALDVALQALDIGACDEVIVTPRTFIASISSIVNAGATPIFADVDEATGNITAETITAVLSEDCAQAHGARYKGRSVGSIGHIGAWSFCQDKIMTTGGEGGMVTTDSELLWRKMWAYKDHGKSYAAVYETEQSPGYNWLHESFGTNLRMTEMQGVLGRIQLNKMSEWTTKRTANAQAILDACSKWESKGYLLVPRLEHLAQFSNANHAYYKLYVYVQSDNLPDGWTRDRIIEAINNQGVPCFSGSASEVYLEKAFDNTGLRPSIRLPMAKKLGESSLMFLVHPTLTAAEIELTMRAIDSVFGSMVE